MKITKQRLKQIIKEEVQAKLQEIEDEDIVSKQADVDEKAEQAAEDVMGEIEELFETEINEAVKLQFRRKKQTPTKTKTKEIEVPTDEEAFTVLQRIVKSINKKALEYETDPEQVAELIDYKTQVYKNMAKKMGNNVDCLYSRWVFNTYTKWFGPRTSRKSTAESRTPSAEYRGIPKPRCYGF